MSNRSDSHRTYRKRIRLDRASYSVPDAICFVTIAVRNRRPIFAEFPVARATVDVLRAQTLKAGVRVYAYCVMPDHVHLVFSPSESCDVLTFVGQFKNLAQRRAWTLGVQGTFWQTSFWDHFLRHDEDIGRVVQYVLDNPVRKGLVTDHRAYPFSGSLVFDL